MDRDLKLGRFDTVSIAGTAVFGALALILGAASQALGLNFPIIPYLQFDLGEVAIVLAFFIFGPAPAAASSFVEFLGLMVFGQQIPVGDFPLLQEFLHRELCRGIRRSWRTWFVLKLYDQAVLLRHPLDSRGQFHLPALDLQIHFVLALLDLCENLFWIRSQNVVE